MVPVIRPEDNVIFIYSRIYDKKHDHDVFHYGTATFKHVKTKKWLKIEF